MCRFSGPVYVYRFTWSYQRLQSPPQKSKAPASTRPKAKTKPAGPLSVPSDSLPRPSVRPCPIPRGPPPYSLGSKAARKQQSSSHPPNQTLLHNHNLPPPPLLFSASPLPCSAPKRQEPTPANPRVREGRKEGTSSAPAYPQLTPNSNVVADESLRHLPTNSRPSPPPLGFSSSSWWAPTASSHRERE